MENFAQHHHSIHLHANDCVLCWKHMLLTIRTFIWSGVLSALPFVLTRTQQKHSGSINAAELRHATVSIWYCEAAVNCSSVLKLSQNWRKNHSICFHMRFEVHYYACNVHASREEKCTRKSIKIRAHVKPKGHDARASVVLHKIGSNHSFCFCVDLKRCHTMITTWNYGDDEVASKLYLLLLPPTAHSPQRSTFGSHMKSISKSKRIQFEKWLHNTPWLLI